MRKFIKVFWMFVPFLFLLFQANAQNKTITGSVKNNSGESIPLATVQEKNTTNFATANESGNFTITLQKPSAVLLISSAGYVSKEITVSAAKNYDIVLETSGTLDDVMVVAYGTSTKKSFTGAASVIKQDEIKDAPITSFEKALNGKVPGLQVTQSTGQAGAVSSIRIRGFGSMNASNEPLYVIDGIPVVSGSGGQLGGSILTSNNIMSSLNPADIESITILKDAAASSLYGSRAANGVIIITTKKGKAGKPVISLKSAVGFTPDWATKNYEPATVEENINMLYQIYHDYNTTAGKTDAVASADAINRLKTKFNKHGYTFTPSGTGRYDNVTITGLTDGVENRDGKYFDWEKELFTTGFYNTNDLSVSGASNGTNYYTSLSYTKDNSRVKDNEYDRISGRVNLTQKVGKLLELMTNINIASSKQKGFNDSRNTGTNMFFQSRNLLFPLYWPTDYKTGLPYTARYGSLAYNNTYYRTQWDNGSKNFNVNAIAGLTLHLTQDLTAKSLFSYNDTRIREFLYYSSRHFNGQASNGSIDEFFTDYKKLVSSNTLNYNKVLNKHSIDLLVGYEAEKNVTDFMRSSGTNLPSDVVHTVATAGVKSSNGYWWGDNLVSYLSRLDYNYNQKYYASFSFRRDGSSRLAPNTRWGNFWSVGLSYRLDQEDFIKNIEAISNLRIRASYGVNGTLPSGSYAWRKLYEFTNTYKDLAGGTITTSGNPDLRWEKNYTKDIAIEFGLFKQRLTGSVEYFNRISKDLLQNVPTSLVTGFSSYINNIGQISNKGIEIELGGDIVQKNNFRWGVAVNATLLKSNIDKLYRPEGAATGNDIIWLDPTGNDGRAQYIFREGNPYLSFYGYEFAGIDKTNGKSMYYVNNPADPKAGDFDLNGRGATYAFGRANYVIIGNATPKAYGGINTDVEYKGLSLALNFIYKMGGNIYDGGLKDVSDDGYYWERIRAQYTWDNMWTDAHTNATVPKLSGNDLIDPMQFSTRNMFDASFIRLKNITAAYKIPTSILQKVKITNARIFVNGTNLLTSAKYKIADPEVGQYGTRGWELPVGKTYTVGIELSF